jgi:hypothetical protein
LSIIVIRRYPSRKVGKLAVIEDQKRLVPRASQELFFGNVEALIRQLESSMVDRDAGLGAQYPVRSNGILGSHVHRRHEPAWLVRSDRQQREARRSEPFPNLGEVTSERGISREIYEPFTAFDHIPAPEGRVAVVNSPPGGMQSWDAVDGEAPQ